MKKINFRLLSILFVLVVTLSSCEAIAGIFKAGLWTGIIIIVLVIALILYFVRKSK